MKPRSVFKIYKKKLAFLKISSLTLLAGLGLCLFPLMSCKALKEKEHFECSLVELAENTDSGYYDAIIKVEDLKLDDALKTRFVLSTPTSSHEIADLTFVEDGQDPERLETGDVFTVPLRKPDWRFYVREQKNIYCSHDFWEMLPVNNQWHPTKSEAMEVAQNIEIESVEGLPKPMAKILSEEWHLIADKLPDPDDPAGYVIYQKIRAEEIKEEVNILYYFLTEPEIKELFSGTGTEFLFNWTDWAKKYGKPKTIAGHDAVYWDMKEMSELSWAYRYAYIDSEMVVEIDIRADPLEWVKTEQEKILEGKAKKVFLRYGYGPVGDLDWQIMIEIWMNGEGAFHKRSKEEGSIQKSFRLEDRELEQIQISINENRFRDLHSRSGIPGGVTSFLSVRYWDQYHTVELKNVTVPLYQNIEQTIRRIVLPKVDEKSVN